MATTQLITNKFAIFSTKAKLDAAINDGYLQPGSIGFCKEAGKECLWTHGTYYKCDLSRTDVQSAVTALNATNSELPINSNAVRNLLATLGFPGASGDNNQAIVQVTQDNGVVSATKGDIGANHVTLDSTNISSTTQTTVQGAIAEIYTKIEDTADDAVVEVYRGNTKLGANDSISAGTEYTIKQGGTAICKIDIAADMVVKSGDVFTADGTEKLGTAQNAASAGLTSGKTYIKLEIANEDTTKNLLYIDAENLVKDHTAGATDTITVEISNNRVITAEVNDNSIGWGHLTNGNGGLQNKIDAQQTTISTTVTEITNPSTPPTTHITVSKTTSQNEATGVGDGYTISEYDIASDSYVGKFTPIGNETTVVGYIDAKVDAMGGENLWEPGASNTSSLKSKSNRTAPTSIAGERSIAAGDYTVTNNYGEAAFGIYNVSSKNAQDNTGSGNTIFSVGIGTGASARENGLELRANGNLYGQYGNPDAQSPSYTLTNLTRKFFNEFEWYEDLT